MHCGFLVKLGGQYIRSYLFYKDKLVELHCVYIYIYIQYDAISLLHFNVVCVSSFLHWECYVLLKSNTNCILLVIWSDPLFSSVCSALCFTCFNASLHSSMRYATRIPRNPRPRLGYNLMQQLFLKMQRNAKKRQFLLCGMCFWTYPTRPHNTSKGGQSRFLIYSVS